jgi:hypothetical protein
MIVTRGCDTVSPSEAIGYSLLAEPMITNSASNGSKKVACLGNGQ